MHHVMTSKKKEKERRDMPCPSLGFAYLIDYFLTYLLTRQTDQLLDVLALFVMLLLHKNLQKLNGMNVKTSTAPKALLYLLAMLFLCAS